MNYKIIQQFIPSDLCQALIDDYVSHTPSDAHRWHGGRKLIPSTSIEFKDLLSKSEAWSNLSKYLNSQGFSELILKELEIPNSKIKTTRYFSRLASRLTSFRRRSSGMIRNANPFFLILWALYSTIIRGLAFLYAFVFRAMGYRLAEIFYDASSASNGYSREIHRDSDARIFVFLLYLNQVRESEGSSGGDLCLHKFSAPGGEKLAQPDVVDAPIALSIEPAAGTLVFFENDEDALHSVTRMSGIVGERFFIYGSLTLLSGRNERFAYSKEKLPTDFRMYL